MTDDVFLRPKFFRLRDAERKSEILGLAADSCKRNSQNGETNANTVLEEVLMLGEDAAIKFIAERPNTVRRMLSMCDANGTAKMIATFVANMPHEAQARAFRQPGMFESLVYADDLDGKLIRALATHEPDIQVAALSKVPDHDAYSHDGVMLSIIEYGNPQSVIDCLEEFCPKAQEEILTSAHIIETCGKSRRDKLFNVIENLPPKNRIAVLGEKIAALSDYKSHIHRTMALLEFMPEEELNKIEDTYLLIENLAGADRGYRDRVFSIYDKANCSSNILKSVSEGFANASCTHEAKIMQKRAVDAQLMETMQKRFPNYGRQKPLSPTAE